ncbi:TerD family protein, partial [Streptomyces scabiei]|nr:TerD family protein [Streptomyces scabiei]
PQQSGYCYPHPQPTPATTNGPAYGYPQPTAAALDPGFRLPPQGPQFIGR